MNKVDTGPLRQLYDHLGIEPDYVMPSFVSYQLQERSPDEKLPDTLTTSIDKLRDLAVISRDYLQIGALEFAVGLDFLHGGRSDEAVGYFEAALRQWIFIDHLPLVSLAHFGAGMAHHEAGEYHQAAAAYLQVKQCLRQAEAEPHRLEKFEEERSLGAFWNDLERWLELRTTKLRREFNQAQDDKVRAEIGDHPGQPSPESKDQREAPKELTTLRLEMQSVGSMSADSIDALVFKTLDGIMLLSEALTPAGAGRRNLQPTISRLEYKGQEPISIEIANVSKHAVNFCRWLVLKVSSETQSTDSFSPGDDRTTTWFRWQGQSGYLNQIVKTFVQSAVGKVLDEADVDQLVQFCGHLAELRLNCRLTVR